MKTKTVFIILIFLISALIISADEFNREHRDSNDGIIFIDTAPLSPKPDINKNYNKPGRSEVVIVASAILSPTPNNAFYTKYNSIDSFYEKKINSKEYKDIITPTIYMIVGKFDKKDYVTAIYHLGNDSEINSVRTKIPKDRIVKIDCMKAYLADIEIFGITLPVSMEFSVPKSVNYVYIGSFVYEWEGHDFRIKNVQQIDDYNNAAKFVAEKYGADAKLERATLQKITTKRK